MYGGVTYGGSTFGGIMAHVRVPAAQMPWGFGQILDLVGAIGESGATTGARSAVLAMSRGESGVLDEVGSSGEVLRIASGVSEILE